MREWLKSERKKRKMTQTEVASRMGISQNTYSRLEAGTYQRKIELGTANKIKRIFAIPLEKISLLEEGINYAAHDSQSLRCQNGEQ